MFETLDSFTLFFVISLALIILLIVFEDKLAALEKKHEAKKHAKRKITIKEVRRNENRGAAKSA